MSTAIVPIDDMSRMAEAIAKSQLFGMKSPEQVLALMLIANAEGKHPAIVARDYDIIQGRPAKKAEAMLRDFLDAGGSVQWHQLDDTCADATFSHPQGGTVRISWDHARAKKAGLSGKDMYSKYARQMLRSRVVSEGCKTVYPAATSGLYEPGEVRQIVREEKDITPPKDEDDEKLKELEQRTESAPPPATPPSADSPVIPTAGGAEAAPRFINADQAIALEDRCKEVGKAGWQTLKSNLLTRINRVNKSNITMFSQLPPDDYDSAMIWLDSHDKEPVR